MKRVVLTRNDRDSIRTNSNTHARYGSLRISNNMSDRFHLGFVVPLPDDIALVWDGFEVPHDTPPATYYTNLIQRYSPHTRKILLKTVLADESKLVRGGGGDRYFIPQTYMRRLARYAGYPCLIIDATVDNVARTEAVVSPSAFYIQALQFRVPEQLRAIKMNNKDVPLVFTNKKFNARNTCCFANAVLYEQRRAVRIGIMAHPQCPLTKYHQRLVQCKLFKWYACYHVRKNTTTSSS